MSSLSLPKLRSDFFQLFNNEWLRWVVLGLAAFLLLFAQSSRTRLTTDPIHYAVIAKTMANSADFLTVKFGDKPY